jgi:hypothetical protein
MNGLTSSFVSGNVTIGSVATSTGNTLTVGGNVGITGNISLKGGTLAVINGNLTLNGNTVGGSSGSSGTIGNVNLTGNLFVTPTCPAAALGGLGVASGATSWVNNNVTWIASASTTRDNAANVSFIGLNSGASVSSNYLRWASAQSIYSTTGGNIGQYTGTVSTTVTGVGAVNGEYMQLQANVALTPYTFSYASFGYNTAGIAPTAWFLVGSTDNATWYPIQSASISLGKLNINGSGGTPQILVNYSGTQTFSSGTVTSTTYSTTTNTYSYFRFIITLNGYIPGVLNPNASYTEISSFNILFSQPTTSTTYLSGNYYQQNGLNIAGGLTMNGPIIPIYQQLPSCPGQIGYIYQSLIAYPFAIGTTANWQASMYMLPFLPVGVYQLCGDIKLTSTTSGQIFTFSTVGYNNFTSYGLNAAAGYSYTATSTSLIIPVYGLFTMYDPFNRIYFNLVSNTGTASATCNVFCVRIA